MKGKVNGSRSKRCSLPSDYMTAAQKRHLNGEVKTYNLKRPMEWKVFKSMSGNLQYDYLKFLSTECEGRGIDIAEMFGVTNKTFSHYKTSNFPSLKEKHGGNNANRYTVSPKWTAFINGGTEMPHEDKPTEEVKPEPVPPANVISPERIAEAVASTAQFSPKPHCVGVTKGTVTIVGNYLDVRQTMDVLLNHSDKYKLVMEWEVLTDEQ